MATIDEKLLEVREHTGDGYLPLIDYGAWRVAILNYSDGLLPQSIAHMQRHNETDEVFVLLQGRCILFLGEGEEHATAIHPQDMELLKVYNVRKAVWHTHTLSEDAAVLIVENRDTTVDNSPFCSLNAAQRQEIITLTRQLWEK